MTLLKAENIVLSFKKEQQRRLFGQERTTVLHGIDLELNTSECLGIIGESGSGKSTLGRVLCGLLAPDSGRVLINGVELYGRRTKQGNSLVRNKMAVVFQDYSTSVNPRFRVQSILHESFRALRLAGAQISSEEEYRRSCELLERVGLDAAFMTRYPHELSGGQLQRVCIARAVALKPQIILLDEAVSSLDAATQVQVMDLLKDLAKEHSLSYLFITHDLTAITYFCDRVRFMHGGRFVESVDDISKIHQIKNAYARELLHAVSSIGIPKIDSLAELEAAERDMETIPNTSDVKHADTRVYF
ncbi:MAG: ABC transporter ATP-binding protein [Duodenibacillus sp.]|nr:ABC transporter ATP-binding protein [Duodenibacillus sp.]